ncbi:MAG: hypothetical protein KBB11_09265 [Bacteroidales bacterium]|nr:hypothetical protein [Bacteroidales bacterium]HOY39634.1 hypothetical protein [Bacteroidales bacterium]HQP04890.1 hypothetical protein [Bacteroidales bacterium]
MKKLFVALALILSGLAAMSQKVQLKPVFDVNEYIDMLGIIARQVDTPWTDVKIPLNDKYQFDYRSGVFGFDNRWDLWISSDSVLVIDMHATTGSTESWLENFYAAMAPASGSWQVSPEKLFIYKLARDERAAVHTGWLSTLAFMGDDILHKLDSCIKLGYRDLIVTGHSQGGAIAYLCTSWLRHKQLDGKFPADFRIKTYCSAAPKPGNLYYAYDYERITATGWAYNVVNPYDWIPETPFTVQATTDFSPGNPFTHARKTIKKQSFPANIIMNHVYQRVNKPLNRTVRRFNHFLGKKVQRISQKRISVNPPLYDGGLNYSRTGNFIVLDADSAYLDRYGRGEVRTFAHHMLGPYYYLAKQLRQKGILNK